MNNKPKWNGKDYLDRDKDILLSNNNLTELPVDFSDADSDSFNDFHCYNNKLTSLIGSPRETKRSVICGGNLIKNLIGASEKVGGVF